MRDIDPATSPTLTAGPEEARDWDADEAQLRKRQRVSNACDECRSKKIKCNGQRPVCGPCRRRRNASSNCTWGERQIRRNGTVKDELMRLQQRLNELESGIQPTTLAIQPQVLRQPLPLFPSAVEFNVGTDPSRTEDEHQPEPALVDNTLQKSRDLYDSSLTGFTSQVLRILEHQPPTTQGVRTHQSGQVFAVGRPTRHYDIPVDHDRADRLLAIYWRLIGNLYQFLDEDEIQSQYERIWNGGDDPGHDDHLLGCMFSVIFATAALLDTSTSPEERSRESSLFYQKARSLLDFELLDHKSVLQVQLYLLLGHYLLSSDDPQQASILSEHATRTARNVGLDSPSFTTDAPSIRQEQAMRRIWHGCVLLDRIVATTLGRPAMLTAGQAIAVPRPLPHLPGSVCGCYGTEEHHSGQVGDNSLHFLVEVLDLYEILNEGNNLIFHPPEHQAVAPDDTSKLFFGSSGSSAISDVLGLDQRMLLWSRKMPLHLHYTTAKLNTPAEYRQINVLYLIYRNLRTLLLRPVLTRFCSVREITRSTLQDTLPWRLAHQFSVSCIQSALETVEFYDRFMAGKDLSTLDELLPPWWSSVFYLHTAALVLVCARLHPAIVAEMTETTITNGCNKAIALLARFECFGPQARKCRTKVVTLFQEAAQQCRQREQLARERRQLQHDTLIKEYLSRFARRNGDQQRPGSVEATTTTARTRLQTNPTTFAQQQQQQQDIDIGSDPTNGLPVDNDNSQQWLMDDSNFRVDETMPASMTDSSASFVFDTSEIPLDLGDMSWLMSQEKGSFFT